MQHTVFEIKINSLLHKFNMLKVPFFSAVVAGFLTHGFAFSNKLPNADELWALFTKGATTTSGRWALELSKYLFPNYSMPWIYGILSLIFLSFSACILIRAFKIESLLMQILAAVLFVSFPSTVGLFSFMFTAVSYSFAIFLTSVSFYYISRYEKLKAIFGIFVFSLAISIYQANVPFLASLIVILLLSEIINDGFDFLRVLKHCLYYLAVLLFSLIFYYLELKIVCFIWNIPLENAYGLSDVPLLTRLRLPYSSYIGIFIKGYYGFARKPFICICYLFCLLSAFFIGFNCVLKSFASDKKSLFLYIALFAAYPYAVNSLYLIAEPGVIHSLSQYSFSTIFFLFAVFLDKYFDGSIIKGIIKDTCFILTLFIMISNVYLANQAYLKMYLNYEASCSFFTTLLADIHSTEGYTKESPVVTIGNPSSSFYDIDDYFELGDLFGPSDDLRTVYTNEWLIKYYLGSSINLSDIQPDTDTSNMPSYPDYGSIKNIDGIIVVKFS